MPKTFLITKSKNKKGKQLENLFFANATSKLHFWTKVKQCPIVFLSHSFVLSATLQTINVEAKYLPYDKS